MIEPIEATKQGIIWIQDNLSKEKHNPLYKYNRLNIFSNFGKEKEGKKYSIGQIVAGISN